MPRRIAGNVYDYIDDVKGNHTPRDVDVTRWSNNTRGFIKFCGALSKNKSILFLVLRGKFFNNLCMQEELIPECAGDSSIYHGLPPSVSKAMGRTISINTHLVHISYVPHYANNHKFAFHGLLLCSIHGKAIGDVGATFLANGLKRNKTLRSLALSSNNIRTQGLTNLSNAVASHPSLTALE